MQIIVFAILLIILFIFIYVYYLTQMDNLIAIQISALTPEQVANFSVLQIQALSTVQLGVLTPEQYKAMTNKAAFTQTQYILMSKTTLKGIVGSIPSDILAFLMTNNVLSTSDLTLSQINGLTLTASQMNVLSAQQVLEWIANNPLQAAGANSNLKPTQILGVALLIPTPVSSSNKLFIEMVTIAQLNGMTTSELQRLPKSFLTNLRQTQISAILPSLIIKFTPTQMTWFTPTQMTWFTTAAIGALTPEQIAAIS